jgi:maltooligosyltrehalose trehalohydrolase
MFLQNHDQIGNRAFGDRLRALARNDDALRAATALLLLSPQIPLLFMDEEYGSTQPFQYFTAYTGDLADAVREGRRREFAAFSSFADPARRAQIPDPNDERTFAASSPPSGDDAQSRERLEWLHFYKSALAVRMGLIVPRLKHTSADHATVLVDDAGHDTAALIARWKLADGETLSIAVNLGRDDVALPQQPDGTVVFETPPRARDRIDAQVLPAGACVAWLTGNVQGYAQQHNDWNAPNGERAR